MVSVSEREAREHRAVLFAIARRMCDGDEQLANDLVQDAFARALEAWPRLDRAANVRGWLVTIMQRRFIDRYRASKRLRGRVYCEIEACAAVTDAEPSLAHEVTSAQLEAAIAALDDEFRRVFEANAAGRRYQQIAAEFGISPGTVGSRLARARKKIRAHLVAQLAGHAPATRCAIRA